MRQTDNKEQEHGKKHPRESEETNKQILECYQEARRENKELMACLNKYGVKTQGRISGTGGT